MIFGINFKKILIIFCLEAALPRFSYHPVCKRQVSKLGIETFKAVPFFLFFLDINKLEMPRFETSCLETGVKTLVTETGQQMPPS